MLINTASGRASQAQATPPMLATPSTEPRPWTHRERGDGTCLSAGEPGFNSPSPNTHCPLPKGLAWGHLDPHPWAEPDPRCPPSLRVACVPYRRVSWYLSWTFQGYSGQRGRGAGQRGLVGLANGVCQAAGEGHLSLNGVRPSLADHREAASLQGPQCPPQEGHELPILRPDWVRKGAGPGSAPESSV